MSILPNWFHVGTYVESDIKISGIGYKAKGYITEIDLDFDCEKHGSSFACKITFDEEKFVIFNNGWNCIQYVHKVEIEQPEKTIDN